MPWVPSIAGLRLCFGVHISYVHCALGTSVRDAGRLSHPPFRGALQERGTPPAACGAGRTHWQAHRGPNPAKWPLRSGKMPISPDFRSPATAMTSVLRLSDLVSEGKIAGKRVFIRADLNVPQDDAGHITEDTRIRASVPAIEACLKAGAAVMVTSHLGRRTEGEFKPEDSLAPVAARLGELLGKPVKLVQNWVDGGGEVSQVKPGEVVLLENCRVNKG